LSPSTFDSRIGPKLEIVARTGTPMPPVPSDKNSTGKAVGVQSSPVSSARAAVLSLAVPGQALPGQVALDVGHHHRHARGGQLLGDHLQRLRLTGAGRTGDQAMPVDGGQRDTDLSVRVGGAVHRHRSQFERLALDDIPGSDLLRLAGRRFGGHDPRH
jgi:hypothetical protein